MLIRIVKQFNTVNINNYIYIYTHLNIFIYIYIYNIQWNIVNQDTLVPSNYIRINEFSR